MSFTDLNIKIGADFTGRPAFKDALKATDSLNSSVTSLGRQFATVFSAYKIAQFGKASVKAFMEDEAAARQLSNTLRNIGYGSATAGAEDFIAAMQKQTGILDDVLRPAYAELARVTGDLGTTQNILKTAWNVSAGTGKDFASVVDSLSQAYVGNTKGLKALDTGLTNAELSSKSFSEIMGTLNQQFAGAGQASLNSYAGQISLLSATVASSMETIGKSIIDAFAIINGDTGIGGTISALESATNKLSDFLRLTAASVGILKTAFDPKNWFNPERTQKQVQDILKEYRLKQSIAEQQRTFTQWTPNAPWTAEQKKAAAAAAARAKELAALTKKQAQAQADLNKKKQDAAKLDALSLKYKQAENIFNMEQIELVAAMLSKQTDEDYARIKLKKDLLDLQNAIAAGDLKTATSLAAIVEEDYKRVQAYQAINVAAGIQSGLISNIKYALETFPAAKDLIDLDNLNSAILSLKEIAALLAGLKMPTLTPTTTTTVVPNSQNPFVYPTGKAPTDISSGLYLNQTAVCPICGITVKAVDLDTHITTQHAGVTNTAASVLNSNTVALGAAMSSGFFDLAYAGTEFSGTNINPYQLTDAQAAAYNAAQNVNITIVDNTSGLISIIPDATQQASANGVNTRLVRNTSGLTW